MMTFGIARVSKFFAACVLLVISTNSPALTLYNTIGSPALNTWESISIGLTETGWLVDSYQSGPAATAQEMKWVLGNLDAMYLLTEWNSGPDLTNVDNVKFGSGASSTFDNDTEGWVEAGPSPTVDIYGIAVPTAPLGWTGSFGNPGGSVEADDNFFWNWMSAPSAYLGDQSARYGENLGFDIYIRFTDNVPYPVVALVAPDLQVPEPSVITLIAAGLFMLGLARRRARS